MFTTTVIKRSNPTMGMSAKIYPLVNCSVELLSPLHNRQGICSSHPTLFLILNFIFEYSSRACPDLKTTVYVFQWNLLVT